MPSSLIYLKEQDTEHIAVQTGSGPNDTTGVPGKIKGQTHRGERFPQMQDVFPSTAWHFGETFSNCVSLFS